MSSHDAPSDTLTRQIFFKTLSGKTLVGWFSPHTMGRELVDWVAETLDLPVNLVRIAVGGRPTIAFDKTLDEQDIYSERTLYIIMRMPVTMERQLAEHVAPRTAIAAALAVAAMQDVVPLTEGEREHLVRRREMLANAWLRRPAGQSAGGGVLCAKSLTAEKVEENLVDLLGMIADARRWRAMAGGGVLRAGGGCCPTCRRQCDCCPTCQRPW